MKKSTLTGLTLIVVGILLIVENLIGNNINVWEIIWPSLLIIIGISMHINYFVGKTGEGNIVLAGTLFIIGLIFLGDNFFNFLPEKDFGAVILFGLSIGFFEKYLFQKKSNSSFVLSMVFLILSVYLIARMFLPNVRSIKEFIMPALIIILGLYLVMKNIKNRGEKHEGN